MEENQRIYHPTQIVPSAAVAANRASAEGGIDTSQMNKEKKDERAERVKKRAQEPKELITQYLRTTNFDEDIKAHEKFSKDMCRNAYDIYMMFKTRLKNEGGDAPFPELGGCVKFLIKGLFQNKQIYGWFMDNNRGILLEQVIHKIVGLMIEDRFNFPYVATIYVIEHLLELIDYYWRENDNTQSAETVNERIGPYYHIFRYRSYMTTFLNSEHGIPENIIFPTCANIGATDLIRIRCAPILIMGIVDKPLYVDQYLNTPLDFWAHDMQHAKRQVQETMRYYDVFIKHINYYKRRTLYDLKTIDQFYAYMKKFTDKVIFPMISMKGLPKNSGNKLINYKRAMRAIKKLIIFEVVHEKAWPITQPSLCRNISLRYDEFPVENITFGPSDYDKEKNVIKAFHYLFADPTTIGNVVGKIQTGFYDKVSDPKDYVVPLNYRTSENVATCAMEIMTELACKKIPSFEYFLSLATDRHAMQEFKDIPSLEIARGAKENEPYPKGSKDNVYSDIDLFTYFKPSADVEDTNAQDSLHKQSVVKGYDPSTFEVVVGGFKKNRKSRKKKKYKTKRKTKRKRGKKKKNFKKHYMWNTHGKRYLAKTYKQHVKGSKLGHTHKKVKRKTKRRKRKTKKKRKSKTRRKIKKGGDAPCNFRPNPHEYCRRQALGIGVEDTITENNENTVCNITTGVCEKPSVANPQPVGLTMEEYLALNLVEGEPYP